MYVHSSPPNLPGQCPYDVTKYVNQTEKCLSTSNLRGDGLWDANTSTWRQAPCKRRDCRRHWRRYAIRKYAQIRSKLEPRLRTYHVRLSCKRHIRAGERFRAFSLFVDKLRNTLPEFDMFATWHRNRAGDHVHIGIGTDEIDLTFMTFKAQITQAWRSHFPSKRQHVFDSQCVYVKEYAPLRRLLWYLLFGKQESPRQRPPWEGIPLRSPVKYVPMRHQRQQRKAA